jgi:hypothetical protein
MGVDLQGINAELAEGLGIDIRFNVAFQDIVMPVAQLPDQGNDRRRLASPG